MNATFDWYCPHCGKRKDGGPNDYVIECMKGMRPLVYGLCKDCAIAHHRWIEGASDDRRDFKDHLRGGRGMTRYRKRPIEIEAVRFTGDNKCEIAKFMGISIAELQMSVDTVLRTDGDYRENTHIHIHTLEGTMTANCGDYIVKGVKGEFYPVKPHIFSETYEEIEE